MSFNVAIRADAAEHIGTGHVRRCQSLAAALQRQGAKVRFVMRASRGQADPALPDASISVLALPAGPPAAAAQPTPQTAVDAAVAHAAVAHAGWLGTDWQTDADQTIAQLAGPPVAALIVDHYALDARWHRRVQAALQCPIIAIDDLADRPLAVDLIIDHNQATDHRLKYQAVNQTGCQILGGPRHALLAERFAQAPRNLAAHPVCSIGIFMGGVDFHNLSEAAWQGLREQAGFTGLIEIVSTRASPHLERLATLRSNDAQLQLTLDAPDLAGFFGRHELHIGAGGGATWERCCLGAPTIALIVADNQRQVLLPLADLQVLSLIEQERPDAARIGRQARVMIEQAALRSQLAGNAMRLVDGLGCHRIAQHISNLVSAPCCP